MDKFNYTMLCDFYELTMGNGYFVSGMQEKISYFDLFFRQIPDGGGFANSIYGVIYQRGQFGPASSGRLEARLASGVSASARQAARAALNGSDPTGGAKYFKLASSGHAGTVVGPIVFY